MRQWRGVYLAGVLAALAAPLIAMRFTSEVNWAPGDFVAAAALLGGAGLVYEVAHRVWPTRGRRLAAGVVIAGLVLVIWAHLAVGFF